MVATQSRMSKEFRRELRGAAAGSQGGGFSDASTCQDVHAQDSVESQVSEFVDQLGGHNGIDCNI